MRGIRFVVGAVTVVSVLVSPWASAQQTYPTKTVRVVIPWPPGGLVDTVGRIVLQKMAENLGQQFIIDNRPGASGSLGADLVAKAPPDGYTLIVHSGTHVANPHMYKKLPYDTLKDFVGIGLMAAQTGLFTVHPSLPVKSIKELVALARKQPDEIRYASSGNGTFSHLSVALLNQITNTKMVHIPYKGGGPATTATVSGETQLIVGTPAALLSQLEAKRLRAFAVTSDTRLTRFPELPTVAEAGIPGYEYRGWVAMLAPAGVPRPIVERLNSEIQKAIDSAEVKKRMEHLEPWTMTPEQTAARIRADYDKQGQLIRLTGAKVD
jgi:tripartite-type tricarboxylate transporter receptor subunit TctC